MTTRRTPLSGRSANVSTSMSAAPIARSRSVAQLRLGHRCVSLRLKACQHGPHHNLRIDVTRHFESAAHTEAQYLSVSVQRVNTSIGSKHGWVHKYPPYSMVGSCQFRSCTVVYTARAHGHKSSSICMQEPLTPHETAILCKEMCVPSRCGEVRNARMHCFALDSYSSPVPRLCHR